MKVVEKFVSINGESKRAGELALFIRFKGCNLNCTYCDTKWANEPDCDYQEMTPEKLLDYIEKTKVKNITLTGGEPLLQKDINKLIKMIIDKGFRVEIETNGAVSIESTAALRDKEGFKDLSFTLDYKSPSSGCEDKMILDNFNFIDSRDSVKLVVGNEKDLEKARYIIEKFNLSDRCQVFLSPIFGMIKPEKIVDFMIDKNLNDIKLQIQMHKVIWDPNKRGV